MTTPPPDLRLCTVRLVNALLDSASADVIGVGNFWPRATSALEAAASAATFGEAVSVATRKLQIEVLRPETGVTVAGLATAIGPLLADWSETVRAELPYLIALARIDRQSRKAAHTPAAATTQEESGF